MPPTVALLVIAHPDDECMFFGPLLLASQGTYQWKVLCLSTGNADGKGEVRLEELRVACRILRVDLLTVVDSELMKDGMSEDWDQVCIGQWVQRAVHACHATQVVTFDKQGVSQHPNHISTCLGVQAWYAGLQADARQKIVLQTLVTVPTLVKFLGLTVIPCLLLQAAVAALWGDRATMVPFAWGMTFTPAHKLGRIWNGLRAHRTQFVWYRKLFVLLSLYSYVNFLRKHSGVGKAAPTSAAEKLCKSS